MSKIQFSLLSLNINTMKKQLLERLKKYALSASALAGASATANAQIVYTDINPDDTVTGNGSFFALDLNNDNTPDFSIQVVSYQSSYSGYGYQVAGIVGYGLNSGNSLMGSNTGSSYGYPYALSNGAQINGAASFASSGILAFSLTYNYGTIQFSNSGGNWIGASNKYLGLRINLAGNTHYGWARLTVLANNSFIIHDYAIQMLPNTPIAAGDTVNVPLVVADAVTNVVASDVDNNGDGSDMNVKFNMAIDESTISEYRVMVVKEIDTAAFNLAVAEAVGMTGYTSVAPIGSNIDFELPASANDVDGMPVQEFTPYRVYILSMADGTNAQLNNLSTMSNHVELVSPIAIVCDTAENILLSDVGNVGNGLDLLVTFDGADNENGISEYRIFIVKDSASGNFDLIAAEANSNYKAVTPTGQQISVGMSANTKDTDGDLIKSDIPYRAFILSVADGALAQISVLSNQSNVLTLTEPSGMEYNTTRIARIFATPGEITVESKHKLEENTVIEIFNLAGQKMMHADVEGKTQIINHQLSPGIYLIRISASQHTQTEKLYFP